MENSLYFFTLNKKVSPIFFNREKYSEFNWGVGVLFAKLDDLFETRSG